MGRCRSLSQSVATARADPCRHPNLTLPPEFYYSHKIMSAPQGRSGEHRPPSRLNSWKEIGVYLGRDARTVQRWEKSEGLPIHRHVHESQASVYAIPAELDAWLEKRESSLGKEPQPRSQSIREVRADSNRLNRDGSSAALPKQPRSARRYAIAAAAVVVAAAGVLVWHWTRAAPLTDKDIVVLADFTNTTGEVVFDGALRQALAFELEQSPFLKIMDEGRIKGALLLMGRKPGERITNQMAQEICVREGEKATISGSIASLGKMYLIELQAANCQSGVTLAREQAESVDKERVLAGISAAAKRMRARLGESLSSIQSLDQPLRATTSSLDALRIYSLGYERMVQGSSRTAIPFFLRATELDPNFAMSHFLTGVAYRNVGDVTNGNEALRKAYSLIARVSERERLSISGYYYYCVVHELDKAIDAFEVFARAYPRDFAPRNGLYAVYEARGDYERALLETREALRLQPQSMVHRENIIESSLRLDRIAEAKTVAEQALKLKPDNSLFHRYLVRFGYLEEDRAALE